MACVLMVLRALGMRQHNMATLQRVGRGGAQRGMGQGAARDARSAHKGRGGWVAVGALV